MQEKKEFQPLFDIILVKQLPKETTTSGGLAIPDSVKSVSPNRGVVMAVGTDVSIVKEQDVITYPVSAGVKIIVNDNDYVLLKERQLIGILKNNEVRVL